MGKKRRDMSMVVAVGEIEGHTIEVLKIPLSEPERFEWRAVKDDVIVVHPKSFFMSPYEAIDASIKHFYPDYEQPEFREPDAKDFEVLNALLYVGGTQEDITDIETAVGVYASMANAVGAIGAVKERAQSDVEDIEDVLASSNHGSTEAIKNLGQLNGVFQSQCDTLILVLQRSMETLHTFITEFVR